MRSFFIVIVAFFGDMVVAGGGSGQGERVARRRWAGRGRRGGDARGVGNGG
jgi:hypothetical protein